MANNSKKVARDFRRAVIVQPYGYSMSVYFTRDLNRVSRTIVGDEVLRWSKHARARHIFDATSFESVVVFYRDVTLREIAHEAFHVAHRIMERIGHHIQPDGHEPHAWLLDWVFDWLLTQARKAGLRPQ